MRNDDKGRRGPDNSYGADGRKRSDYSDDGLRPEYNDDSNEIIIGGDKNDIDFDEYAARLERRASKVQRRPSIEYEEDDHPTRRERKLIARRKRDAAAAEQSGDDIVIGSDGGTERRPLTIERTESAPDHAGPVLKVRRRADSSAPGGTDGENAADAIAEDIAEAAEDEVEDIGEAVRDKLDKAAEKIEDIKEAVADKAEDAIEAVRDKAEDVIEAVEDIKDAVKDKAEDVREAVMDKAEDVREAVEDKVEDAKEAVEDLKDAVKDKAGNVREAVKDKAVDIKEAVEEKTEDIKEAVEDKAEDIKEAVEDKAGDVGESVRGRAASAGRAVKNRAEAAADSIEDAAETVTSAAGIAAAAAAAKAAEAKAEEEIDVLDALLDGDDSGDGDYYGDDDEDEEEDDTDDSFLDDYFGEPAEGGEDEEYEEEDEEEFEEEDEEEFEEEYEEEDAGSDEEYPDGVEEADEDYPDEEEEAAEEYPEEDEEYDGEPDEEDGDYGEDYTDDYGYGEDEDFFIPTGSELDEDGLPIPVVKPRNLEAVRLARAAAEASEELTDKNAFRKEFLVSASPHIHCGETTRVIMGDVVIALIPALIASVLWFGWRALMLSAVCVASCVATEFFCRRIMKRRQTVGDLSAVVTGLLLAFCLPPELNPVFAIIGSIVAIAVVKQMFGGIGSNFANPAATARIVMMLSFPAAMTTWSRPFYYYLDAVSEATPLSRLSDPAAMLPTHTELLVGYHSGCLGETCAIALFLGGAYLLLRRVISWEIPASFMGTVILFSLIAGQDPIYQLLSGGVVLGALFMATDYVTSPVNRNGRLIFGFGCGLFTMLIRLYGNMPEGVSFAILLMNILTPHIDRLTLSVPFGEERKKA